jgi:gas vesicle protein
MSADGIRADIEATRTRMGETLEELGTRLNPDRLKEQAKEAIHDATIGRVQTMARNTAGKAADTGRRITDVIRDNPIPAAMVVAGLGWMIFGGKRNIAPQVQGVADRATEGATAIAATMSSTVSESARAGTQKVSGAFEENPLALGAVALAVGVATGFALPSTRREGELFGEAKESVVDRAKEIVSEKKEQAQHVAERVVSEAKTTVAAAARDEGLAS